MARFLRFWSSPQRALVIGGSGALGSSVISVFKKNWETTSLDFTENKEASFNILINPADDAEKHLAQADAVLKGQYDLILSTAGGWCQGDIESPNVFSQVEMMMRNNVYPSVLAGHLATKYASETGIIILSGSLLVYKENTPSMLAYGICKNMVHNVALNLATKQKLTSENRIICLVPDILNTEVNRKSMPSADHTKWVSPRKIAEKLHEWGQGKNVPKNGSFVSFKLDKDVTVEYV
jgi:NAD(P)-dependent dehydrogenase (short-subunit alcohol dehydrogenase family)